MIKIICKSSCYDAFLTASILFCFVLLLNAPTVMAQMNNPGELKGHIEYQQNKYLLGPGDVLSLKVLHEPDYEQSDILVRPDGYASFVGVGELNVANRTIESVSQLITEALSKTMVSPSLMLTVKKMRPAIVYLAGAVAHPGMFQFTTDSNDRNFTVKSDETLTRMDMRLSNILANAGGVTLNADLSNIKVTRSETGESVTADLWKVIRDGNQALDLWVNAGDRIEVPAASNPSLSDQDFRLLLGSSIGPKSFPVRVIGEVKMPGVYYLDAVTPFLNSAVAKAQGYAPQASQHIIAIRRFTDESHFTNLFVENSKYDVVLRPNDVVFIPEQRLYKAGRIGAEVARIFSPVQSAAMSAGWGAQIFGYGGWNPALRYGSK